MGSQASGRTRAKARGGSGVGRGGVGGKSLSSSAATEGWNLVVPLAVDELVGGSDVAGGDDVVGSGPSKMRASGRRRLMKRVTSMPSGKAIRACTAPLAMIVVPDA